MAPQAASPVEVFVSYSHKDDEMRERLGTHLSMLKRKGVVSEWNDRRILPGQEWDKQIDRHLESADIILLLVSPDFVASDYCYDIELTRAMQRHETGEARVIPVILRFTDDWQSAPFGKIQALPKDARPVKDWNDRDKAFADVAAGIRRAVEELLAAREKPVETHDAPEKASPPSLIPRPPVIGFVSRRDPQGRDIVARLKDELAPGRTQLVTLSGPGGIGKTTLAAQAARELQAVYEGRVVWSSADGRADFTFLSLLDDIATQLGSAGLRTLAPAEKEERVRAVAAGTLVVLDNYETVAEAERARVEVWFKRTQCSALFTSRPRVPDTAFIPVSAMSREEGAEFLEKLAGQTQDSQLFTPEVREQVYETAEANPYVMQWVVAQIDEAQEPDEVLKELAEGEGDAAERVFARSFDLPRVGDDGRAALLALSLFAPNASREALAAVAGLGEDRKRLDEAAKHLHALWLVKGVDGNRRLAVEGLTRSLAAARRSKDPRDAEFRRRFVAYFVEFAERHKAESAENYDRLEEEKDNLLGAAETALSVGLRGSLIRISEAITHPLSGMLFVRGYWDEAVRLAGQSLETARSAQVGESILAVLTHNLGTMHSNRAEWDEARRLCEESLELSKRTGKRAGVASTLSQLGRIAESWGEAEEARRLYHESLEINKELGDQRVTAATLCGLSRLSTDDPDEALRMLDESLGLYRELGDRKAIAGTLHDLGNLAFSRGGRDEARRRYDESLEIYQESGNRGGIAAVLHQLGMLAHIKGEWEEARRLYGESLKISQGLGNQEYVGSTLNQLGQLAEVEGDKKEAARLLREALKIFERIGSPNAEIARQSLARVEGEDS